MRRARARHERASRPPGELTSDEEARLRALLRRADALGNAYLVVAESAQPCSERKEEMLEVLGELKADAQEQFRLYRQKFGIPERGASS